MLEEIRIYTPKPGKGEALRERFRTKTLPIFKRLGIDVTGAYAATDGSDTLWYTLRYPDEATRTKLWAEFGRDAEWASVKAASETDGPLLDSQKIVGLRSLV
ncbi:NIPSNAP family protein [Enterovirga sp.]|jgi:hypothetical protein|uniref:NIPSNAP family protein n=1 Tax=Enterovirga sp. TaxID=2026350 RepID=UPI002630EF03|nr:NIPSNAP family protein [Enterovirga sp.]MDB5592039.1 hypothetical protein [Enterovirga sp.]